MKILFIILKQKKMILNIERYFKVLFLKNNKIYDFD